MNEPGPLGTVSDTVMMSKPTLNDLQSNNAITISITTTINCRFLMHLLQYAHKCITAVLCLQCFHLTLLVGGQEGHPACNNRVVRCWHGYLSGSRCRLDVAQLMPLPLTVSCFSKIQIGFTFLVPAHLGSPGKEPLNGCVSVCVHYSSS